MDKLLQLKQEMSKMPLKFPERESDEYDLGYVSCWLDIDYILNSLLTQKEHDHKILVNTILKIKDKEFIKELKHILKENKEYDSYDASDEQLTEGIVDLIKKYEK